MRKFYLFVLALALSVLAPAVQAQTVLNNTVVFVRFADEAATGPGAVFQTYTAEHYDSLFNASSPTYNSVYNYFRQASYRKLDWRSRLLPAAEGGKVMSYRAKMERGYYQERSSINPTGYPKGDATAMEARRHALIKEIVGYLDKHLPEGYQVDANGDGIVDNLTIVLSGTSAVGNTHLLWPQRSNYILGGNIQGKRVVSFLMVFDESNGFNLGAASTYIPLNTGVLCHEMSHNLGTYDLYHGTKDGLNPVGVWDLMSNNQLIAQHMTAYTKWRYCHWLDSIPLISKPDIYTLNPIGGNTDENVAYKIQPVGHREYFVIEYRRKEGFDASLPESGLIIYRINPDLTGGNLGYNGTTRLDEQYIFRPGGTPTSDGDLSRAAFSADNGRTAFGGSAALRPFYSDGSEANFAIANISAVGPVMTFELLPSAHRIVLDQTTVNLAGRAQSGATVKVSSDGAWRASGIPAWLTLSQTEGDKGDTQLVLAAQSANTTQDPRTADIIFTDKANPSVTATLHVTQSCQTKANVILYEDWENTSNPNGWTVQNSDNRGWDLTRTLQTNRGLYRSYEGTHAATLIEAWDDTHEEQTLISPVFAQGTTLEFWSRTTAANKNPKGNPQFYNVEVSSDGGTTWAQVFNCLTDYPLDADGKSQSGKYVKLTIDLSAHLSDNMRIRFHAYDTGGAGLSYYWNIDNLTITGLPTGLTRLPQTPPSSGKVYTLDGRLVSPTRPHLPAGAYIIDGRKVVKK